jgi:hypothetical protein
MASGVAHSAAGALVSEATAGSGEALECGDLSPLCDDSFYSDLLRMWRELIPATESGV